MGLRRVRARELIAGRDTDGDVGQTGGRATPEGDDMANVGVMPATTRPVPVRIPIREWWPWALFVGVFSLFLLYIVGYDQGALSLFNGTWLHEFVHDGRHVLGFPCH
jgi:hypothetical protein